MEQLTTYRAKGKDIGLVFLFKYDLIGNLKVFKIEEGELNAKQMQWLFSPNFPANESIIKSVWMKEKGYRDKFEVEVSPANLSFDAFWNLYDYKVKRHEAEKTFAKLKEADIIKCFVSVQGYNNYLQRKRVAKAHLSTFINQRYFEDDWSKA